MNKHNNSTHCFYVPVLINDCDEMLKSISMHKAAAVSWVHGRFASYVGLYGEV